jgi:cytochrome c oxidase subunit II
MTRTGYIAAARARLVAFLLLPVAALILGGCDDERVQSVLHPAGPAAERVADLWWVMFGMGTAVFLIVMILTGMAVLRRESDRPPMGNRRFIIAFGLAGPAVVLIVLLIFALQATLALRLPEARHTIQVIGHQWWWEVIYPDHGIITANEIRIPAGEPVRLELRAADVIHSFWVPRLHGKMDLLPEVTNTFWIEATEPGVYRGQCAEFCGVQHARMAFVVVAEPPEAFDEWVRRQTVPPAAPATQELVRGLEIFFDAGCAECHAIRGTPAAPGEVGPDLTHFGSRLTIGAGQRPNTTGDLAGWIANPQTIKPGNKMPPTFLGADELHTLVAFLQSLR